MAKLLNRSTLHAMSEYNRMDTEVADAATTALAYLDQKEALEARVRELEAALNEIAGLGFCVDAEEIAERALGATPQEPAPSPAERWPITLGEGAPGDPATSDHPQEGGPTDAV